MAEWDHSPRSYKRPRLVSEEQELVKDVINLEGSPENVIRQEPRDHHHAANGQDRGAASKADSPAHSHEAGVLEMEGVNWAGVDGTRLANSLHHGADGVAEPFASTSQQDSINAVQPQHGHSRKHGKQRSASSASSAEHADVPYPPHPPSTSFTVTVGSRHFHLSWASLTSDPPNFFTRYFSAPGAGRRVYLDRDPDNFALIVAYLRGYHFMCKDEYQHQNLINDASYLGLNILLQWLISTVFINVGGTVFRVKKSLLEKDSPNYFTGPFIKSIETPFGRPGELPPNYIDRDPNTFKDILRHLQGYTIELRDEVHRRNLLIDAKYYALRGLVDKLLMERRTLNGFGVGTTPRAEVLMQLSDVRNFKVLRPSEESNAPRSEYGPHFFAWAASSDSLDYNTQVRYKKGGSEDVLLLQLPDAFIRCEYTPHTPESPSVATFTIDICPHHMERLQTLAEALKCQRFDSRICLDGSCAIELDDKPVYAEDLRSLGRPNGPVYANTEEGWVSSARACLVDRLRPSPDPDAPPGTKILKLCVSRCIVSAHVLRIDGADALVLCALRMRGVSSKLALNMAREFLDT